ncbi:DUF1427 family protein [Streptomyces incarnatus]|uniref:DUF1427 family protein n=1 Tax=Streptomyces incarnatus TaxID=665007 RepID=UPI003CC674AE
MTSTPPTGWRRRATSIATSLVAGGVMGSVYWLIRVGTPAPPWGALTGLLGMIMGEAAIKATRRRLLAAKLVLRSIRRAATRRLDAARGTRRCFRACPTNHCARRERLPGGCEGRWVV